MKHLRKAAELATAPSRSSRRQEVSGVVEVGASILSSL